jgi:hypothetical protein
MPQIDPNSIQWDDAPAPMPAPAPQRAPGVIMGRPKAPDPIKPPSPTEVWRTMSPEEATSMGLEPGGVYQTNGTGGIKVVQAPAKTEAVQPPNAAPPRERLARIYTALDNLRGLEGLVRPSDMGTGSIVGQESFRAGEDFWGASGWFNQRANDVAGSIEMVQGDLINQVRAEMEQSGTPIGVKGADTEKEASRLAASIANLAQTQDEGNFLVGVQRAREYYIRRLADNFKALQEAGEELPATEILQELLKRGGTQEEITQIGDALGLQVDQDALSANIRSRDSGGGTNAFVPPPNGGGSGGGGGGMAATTIGNTAIGYAQGAAEAVVDFPLAVAGGVQTGANALLDTVIGGGLDAVGANDAADWWRNTGRVEEARRAATANPVSTTVNALAPAPQGFELQRDVARFAGGFLVPGPRGARNPVRAPSAPAATPRATATGAIDNATEVVAEGQRRGVPVFTTDVVPPRGGMGRMAKQTIPEKIPFTGMSGPREAQQAARVELVEEVVQEFGGVVGRELFDSAPTAVEDVARTLGNERAARIGRFKNAKDSVIDGIADPFTAAPNTVRAIQEQVRKLQAIDPEEFAPVIERLQRFGERVTAGGSLRNVEEQRRLLGELFTDPNLARIKTRGQEALNSIYGPLREDMGNFIQQQAGVGPRNRWAKANEELAAMAGELKSARFRNVLRDTDVTPEAVGRILFSDATNVSDMKRLVSNLPPAGQAKVRAALIQRAFDSAGGADGVSVERFLDNLQKLSGKIGVAFEGRERQTLEGVRRLLEATRRAAAAGANIRTGEQNMPTVMGMAATSVLGFAGGVASLGVGGLLARLYESPVMRDRILRLATTKAGSVQESRALEAIMRSATPIVNQWRNNAAAAVNDNAAGALAAEVQNPQED